MEGWLWRVNIPVGAAAPPPPPPARGNFQANEFPFYPLYFIRIRDRGGDEWHGRGEEARETRGGGIEWYSSSGCTSRRKQPDEESERGWVKILKHDLCPRVLNLIHRRLMHLITGSKFWRTRPVCPFPSLSLSLFFPPHFSSAEKVDDTIRVRRVIKIRNTFACI